MLKLNNLSMSYWDGTSNVDILKIKELTIDKGKQVVFTGTSGCGKTTLFNIISGLIVPQEGNVLVNGTDITQLGEADRDLFRAQNIGYVFQDFNLFPDLTVMQNVMLPISFSRRPSMDIHHQSFLGIKLPNRFSRKYSMAEMRKKAIQILKKVGMNDKALQKAKTLSGGEKQRVAIARSLVNNPKIILADEPTGNLDYKNGVKIIELLRSVALDVGSTLLVITHNTNQLELFDQVIRIEDINELSKEECTNDIPVCQD